MTTQFVHLRLRSEYSLVDSIVRIKPLMAAAKAANMPAIGLTDHCNFYGLIKFYTAAQSNGIKPIFGADFWLRGEGEDDKPSLICLLAMNHQGYRNIIDLISRAYQKGQHHGLPYIKREWVSECSEGVIALSGGRQGDVGLALIGGREQVLVRAVP